MERPVRLCLVREAVNLADFALVVLLGRVVTSAMNISGYLTWAVCGVVITALAITVAVVSNLLFYRDSFKAVLRKVGLRL